VGLKTMYLVLHSGSDPPKEHLSDAKPSIIQNYTCKCTGYMTHFCVYRLMHTVTADNYEI